VLHRGTPGRVAWRLTHASQLYVNSIAAYRSVEAE